MKKAILTLVVAVTVIATFVIWLVKPGKKMDQQEILMIAGLVIVVSFALFLSLRRLRDARAQLPSEDEFSRNLMRRGAATSYYVSLYFWLALMFFSDKIQMENHSLIGAGIMGMALIFAGSWMYHRYIRKSHEK